MFKEKPLSAIRSKAQISLRGGLWVGFQKSSETNKKNRIELHWRSKRINTGGFNQSPTKGRKSMPLFRLQFKSQDIMGLANPTEQRKPICGDGIPISTLTRCPLVRFAFIMGLVCVHWLLFRLRVDWVCWPPHRRVLTQH